METEKYRRPEEEEVFFFRNVERLKNCFSFESKTENKIKSGGDTIEDREYDDGRLWWGIFPTQNVRLERQKGGTEAERKRDEEKVWVR
ncbi:hypothetical protein CEXT_142781 [Caerostris extrusa]|uniref:Uncharacterized protein n=1 Tax=Caerostris extrusa TaxID=172846 RepID=A0AAV4UJM5_CAEEX|nr:hypothetical protein CEXT_142781 [Caerostris extrusa]